MKDRVQYLTRIRVVASFAIVILHTFTIFGMAEQGTMSDSEEFATRVVPYLMMWAVPCFVMVSGALLLDEKREITIPRILQRYVLRMVLVLFIFTTVFFLSDLWMNSAEWSSGDIGIILGKFFSDGSWAHLWYLYLLIGLYLMLPVYRLVAKHATKDVLVYLGILYVIFLSVIPAMERLMDVSIGFYLCTSSIFPGYFVLGHLIHTGRLSVKKGMAWGLALLGVLSIVALTWIDFGERQDDMDGLLGNYAFLPVVILSIGCFLLLRGSGKNTESPRMEKLWGFLDRNSFGVYLVHLFFLRWLIKVVKWNPFHTGSFWMLIPVSAGVFAVSLLVTFLLRLIPGVKKLI